ncbi:transposase DNA-binding-containing protein [Caballeronia udeis]|uniref:transposase DNA-binding-containing protein n=1 Tax=Caballeronia udeis TaxID=1232866 RepID=UPI0038504ABD
MTIENRRVDDEEWIDREIADGSFQDSRIRRRSRTLLARPWTGVGQTIPFACQDWGEHERRLPLPVQ